MPSVRELVSAKAIEALATPANMWLGQAIFKGGEVEVTTSRPGHVAFRVGGTVTGRRRVELRSSQGALGWKCTCTSDSGLFCKHLVAAALHLEQC